MALAFYEMIHSSTLSHEVVTNLNTDSKAQRHQSGGSPHVTRRRNKEEQLRQNCGTTGQRDVVLVRVIMALASHVIHPCPHVRNTNRFFDTKVVGVHCGHHL